MARAVAGWRRKARRPADGAAPLERWMASFAASLMPQIAGETVAEGPESERHNGAPLKKIGLRLSGDIGGQLRAVIYRHCRD